mmetsp:Transcript_21052/g.54503  ORF Transcript_21052/g.54503 Transcript_21052/m.54503 type:complete len:353 (-) Transcript_21052:1044-2102(-)
MSPVQVPERRGVLLFFLLSPLVRASFLPRDTLFSRGEGRGHCLQNRHRRALLRVVPSLQKVFCPASVTVDERVGVQKLSTDGPFFPADDGTLRDHAPPERLVRTRYIQGGMRDGDSSHLPGWKRLVLDESPLQIQRVLRCVGQTDLIPIRIETNRVGRPPFQKIPVCGSLVLDPVRPCPEGAKGSIRQDHPYRKGTGRNVIREYLETMRVLSIACPFRKREAVFRRHGDHALALHLEKKGLATFVSFSGAFIVPVALERREPAPPGRPRLFHSVQQTQEIRLLGWVPGLRLLQPQVSFLENGCREVLGRNAGRQRRLGRVRKPLHSSFCFLPLCFFGVDGLWFLQEMLDAVP